MQQFSRRKFVEWMATGFAAVPLVPMARSINGPLTAQQVVDRIKQNIGVEWKSETVDGFKAGDPSTPVTGIVTTALASLHVLATAVKSNANLIITCEPTFYARADTATPPVRLGFAPSAQPPPGPAAADPVFAAKDAFLKQHNLAVWRFSDHWRLHAPDPFSHGLAGALGWSRYTTPADPRQIALPQTSLAALASHVRKNLNSRGGLRIVGDPGLRLRKIALLPGFTAIQASLDALPAADVIIAGEVREWESVEYVRDTVALGGKKAMILLGRIVSENPGMQVCAQWLKTIVPEVPSRFVGLDDPYWRPA